MVLRKWGLMIALLAFAILSYWGLHRLTTDQLLSADNAVDYPDYYIENFTTLSMNHTGLPKNKLSAAYMAYYSNSNKTVLRQPVFEIYQPTQQPIVVKAEKGWLPSGNDIVFLENNVYLYQNDASGVPHTELITDSAQVSVDGDYAETRKPATLIKKHTVTRSVGIKAYPEERRIEFLDDVHTTIKPKPFH